MISTKLFQLLSIILIRMISKFIHFTKCVGVNVASGYGPYCFASVAEAAAVAIAGDMPSVDLSSVRLVGWDSSTARATAIRTNSDGTASLLQLSLPQCGPVNKALPLTVSAKSVDLPIKSYGSDAGVYSMTAFPGSEYAQMPASISAAAGFSGLGFATVLGLYWFSYICGQVIDLIRHAR